LLIPPECIGNQSNFTKKSDVYFYGWILLEMMLGKDIKSYNMQEAKKLIGIDSTTGRDKEVFLYILEMLFQVKKQNHKFVYTNYFNSFFFLLSN